MLKRFFSFFIVLSFFLGFLPGGIIGPFEFKAYADQVSKGSGTWISGKLTYSYSVATSSDNTTDAAGSVSASSNTLTVKATSAKEYETGGCGGTTVAAADTTNTVIVTNASSNPLKINTLTTSGSASVTGVSQGDTIASGATFTITVTSPANGTNATEKSGTVTISVEEQTSVTITLAASPYVSYTVNGVTVEQNGSEQTFTVNAGTTVSLPAITAPSGYEFKGWRVGNNLITGSSFTADAGYTVFPVLVTSGTDIDAANFKVGNITYTFWEDAVRAAVSDSSKTVVVNAETVKLPSTLMDNLLSDSGGTYVRPTSNGGVEYILPPGVTLLVPFDQDNTVITNLNIGSNYEKYQQATSSVKYKELILQNNTSLSVQGKVSVASKVYCMSTGQSGHYGQITLENGSNITFKSGSNLYAFGYIKGTGTVDVLSGANVYESLFVADYPGSASNVSKLTDAKVFPFSKFTVRNVEAPMTFYAGASEQVYFNLYGTSVGYHDVWIKMIGSGAFFQTQGSVTKSYVGGRQHIVTRGNSTISGIQIKISAFGVSIDVSTSQLAGVPIPYNFNITIEEGTTTLNENVILSKGSVTVVNADAELVIPQGKNLYVLDGSDDQQAVGTQPDAVLDVNGSIEATGGLWTSTNGADIKSSGHTGHIKLNSDAPADDRKVKVKNASTTAAEISITAAKLHNGTEVDPAYTETAGAVAGTTYYYCTACVPNGIWETEHKGPTFEVTFDVQGHGTAPDKQNVAEGGKVAKPGALVENETVVDGYVFKGWYKEAACTNAWDFENDPVTENTTLYAKWEKAHVHDWGEPTYTWADDNSTVTATRICKDDASHTETETVNTTSAVTKAATCEAKGETTYTATFTNSAFARQTKTVENIDALGHNWGEPEWTWAADHSSATAVFTCKNDNSHKQTVDATITSVRTEATCEVGGSVVYTATVTFEGKTYSDTKTETIPATGHDWGEWTMTTPATCTEKGVETRTCANDPTHTETREIEALGHDYQAVVTAPTCTEQGYTTYTCSRCGDSYKADYTEALGHDWGEPSWTWAEDHSAATATFTCKHDAGHTKSVNAEVTSEQGPTTDPYKTVYTATATFNGRTYTDTAKEDLVAYYLVGEFNEWTPNPAYRFQPNPNAEGEYMLNTTLEVGKGLKVVCAEGTAIRTWYPGGSNYTVDYAHSGDVTLYFRPAGNWWNDFHEGGFFYISKLHTIEVETNGHGSASIDPASPDYTATVAMTATPDEWYQYDHTEIYKKTGPGESDREIVILASLEWNDTAKTFKMPDYDIIIKVYFKEVTYTGPSWSWDGYTSATATFNGDDGSVKTETATVTSEETTPATCNAAGERTYTATVTFKENTYTDTKTETVPALGHDLVHHEGKAPTCTEIGWSAYDTCSRCDYTTYVEIPAAGHTPADAVRENEVAATCTAAGSYDEVVYCSVCHEELSRETKTIEKLGHAWGEWTVTTEPTCTEAGEETLTCSRCDVTETREINALGHDYQSVVTAPTCTEQGYTTHTCSRCGDSYVDAYVGALGHSWNEGEVTTEPTCTEAGVKTFTCTVCGETKTESIEALGHNEVTDAAVAATCTETGLTEGKHCSRCNEVLVAQKVVPALGHDYGDWTQTTAPSCTETGVETRTCSRCDETETREVPALGHDLVHHDEHAPTCTAVGWDAYDTCTRCDYTTYTEIAALGHNWEFVSFTWTGNDTDGYTADVNYKCKNEASHTQAVNATVTAETTNATCTMPGTVKYTATVSASDSLDGKDHTENKTVTGTALGHAWGEATYEWAADNSTVTATRVCKNDASHTETETVNTTAAVTKPATCEAKGETTYTATFTNTAFETQTKTVENVEATGHDYELTGWTWTGYTGATATFTCKNDSSHVETVTATITSVRTEATCEADGSVIYTATVSFEGKTYTDTKTETLPAIVHDWNAPTYEWAADNSSVTAKRVCKHDASHVETETVNTTSEVTTPATCTTDGVRTYTSAAFTNGAFAVQTKTETIPAIGHDWDAPSYVWADDNSTVTATRVCKNDPSHKETETVDTTSEVTTPATCEGKGKTTYTATFTNAAFEAQTKTVENIDAIGHDWNAPTYEWAADNSSVTAKRVCKNNASHVETETVDTTLVTVSATCELDGSKTWTAAFTNAAFTTQTKTDTIPALGHDWGDWTVTKAATCTEKGEEQRVCANDPTHIEIREVKALGHDLIHHEGKAPTCTEIGWEAYDTCSRCDYTTYVELPATGHDWGEPDWEWTEDGSAATATFTCKNDSSHVETLTGQVTSEQGTGEDYGYTVYTATVTLDGKTYTDTKKVVNQYTIVFANEDGTVLLTARYDYGTPAASIARPEAPSKPATAQYTYSFAGWTPEIAAVTGDATYTATYTSVTNKYKVTFVDWNGTVLKAATEYEYGTPAAEIQQPDEPHKDATAQFNYSFAGWKPELQAVTAEVTYTATYKETLRTYTVFWYDENGETLLEQDENVSYGGTPRFDGKEPAKAATAEFSYLFTGWKNTETGEEYAKNELPPVQGDVCYSAVFTEETNRYTIRFYDGDQLLQSTELPYGETPVYNGEPPAKKADAQYSYAFLGWKVKGTQGNTPLEELPAVTGAADYEAVYSWTVNEYTITWIIDGTEETTTVPYGETPAHADPVKAATAQYSYRFTGWDPAIVPVTGDATYTAVFEAELRSYDIVFQDEDGTVLDAQTLTYGSTPVYGGKTPVKEADAQYTYSFAGWTPAIAEVTGPATYTATYSTETKLYTVTWNDYDGRNLETDTDVAYGDMPSYNGAEPTRAADAQYTYSFAGWTPDVTAVTGNVTYTATYSTTVNRYTVTFVDEDGTVLLPAAKYDYDTPAASIVKPADPVKAADAQYTYSFAGWKPVLADVTANVTYTATYTATVNTYTVTWLPEGGGEALEIDLGVPYGTKPVFEGTVPEKASTAEFDYSFCGWSDGTTVYDPDALPEITGDVSFTAVYTGVKRLYTVTWLNGDGTKLKEIKDIPYGDDLPAYSGDTPTKQATVEFEYVFKEWTTKDTANIGTRTYTEDEVTVTVETVLGNITYTPVFDSQVRSYTVEFRNEDGTVLRTGSQLYGSAIVYGETPEKAQDERYTYRFLGWTLKNGGTEILTTLPAVSGEMIFTAVYEPVERTFTVTWRGADGTVLETDTNVPYGAAPSFDSAEPTKAQDEQCTYTFAGWDPEIGPVTQDVTYTARFKTVPNEEPVDNYGVLIITRGEAAPQDFLYTVKDSTGNVLLQVVLQKGKTQVTITGLPLGDYTVTEETSWSWRYTPEQETVHVNLASAEPVTAAFREKGAEPRQEWLSGETAIVKKYEY